MAATQYAKATVRHLHLGMNDVAADECGIHSDTASVRLLKKQLVAVIASRPSQSTLPKYCTRPYLSLFMTVTTTLLLSTQFVNKRIHTPNKIADHYPRLCG